MQLRISGSAAILRLSFSCLSLRFSDDSLIANTSALYDADGELLIVPQDGELLLETELGRLHVQPHEVALVRAECGPDFLLVVSYNPGYQSVLKDLKPSTRQRFVSLEFDYPALEVEATIIAHESGVAPDLALRLARIAPPDKVGFCLDVGHARLTADGVAGIGNRFDPGEASAVNDGFGRRHDFGLAAGLLALSDEGVRPRAHGT